LFKAVLEVVCMLLFFVVFLPVFKHVIKTAFFKVDQRFLRRPDGLFKLSKGVC